MSKFNGRERQSEFFQEDDGTEPVKDWLIGLAKGNRRVVAKIRKRISRAEAGNFGDYHRLGENWGELRIGRDGYRVYFGVYEDRIILLLHGGTKDSQRDRGRKAGDITIAKERWRRFMRTAHNEKTK